MTAIKEVNAKSTAAIVAGNSLAEIEKRVALGQVSWAGPLLVLTGRTVLAVVAQAIVAGVYLLRGDPTPWRAAAPWWTVYGTLVDIGCLLLMARFMRGEGIGFRDLIGKIRWGRDLLVGVGWFFLVFPFFWFGASFGSKLVWGTTQPDLYPGLLAMRVLPLWAVIYSVSVWWIIWSPTEEMTYQAYVLPRIRALSGRWWITIPLVAFWWALQHSFFPLILDWHYVAWRFLAFLPGVIVFTLIYARTRRLPPLILAHWPMDILAALITIKF